MITKANLFRRLRYLYVVFLIQLCTLWTLAEERVAILGDSIAYAGGWPTYVECHLRQGEKWKDAEIVNFGLPSENVSGLSEPGHAGGAFPRPCLFERLPRILTAFRPTLIIACYGMNDGIMLPPDKDRLNAFARGCEQLNRECQAIGVPIIWITPSLYAPGTDAQYDKTLDAEAAWLKAQTKRGWKVIDIRPNLKRAVASRKKKNPGFVYAGDGVHPGPEGHQMIAEAICPGLQQILNLPKAQFPKGAEWDQAFQRQNTAKNTWLTKTKHIRPQIAGYAGSAVPTTNSEAQISQWNGYEKHDFQVDGRRAFVVLPKTRALGNPWIWRTEFFGHEPQADLELLSRGFAAAYIDMQNMYGSPKAMEVMDQFYDYLVSHYPLSRLCVLEGFSRGGLYAFNWGERNPKKTAAIYADAPVCDFKSWPAGKGKGKGSPDDWKRLLAIYGLTEEQAMRYKGNPVDTLTNLAKNQVPILCVSKTEDTVVPIAENTDRLEKRYQSLGGPIKVIRGHGDHHPHSLKEPAQITDFILEATQQKVPVRIACIGDSITFGSGVNAQQRWTTILQHILGNDYVVHNFGVSARTLLNKGDYPMMKEDAYSRALLVNADIVTIALGTNDSKPHNWKHSKDFVRDYKSMINEIRRQNPNVRIYCLKAIPSLLGDDSISGRRIEKEVNPRIEKIAKQEKCQLIDLWTVMDAHRNQLPDGVHPNATGHKVMAEAIAKQLQEDLKQHPLTTK